MIHWLSTILLGVLISAPGGHGNTIQERNLFATELFQTLATDRQDENVIISPVSIQLALGLAYYGAEGRTAAELQKRCMPPPRRARMVWPRATTTCSTPTSSPRPFER
uniref:Leukocyte elastase inhibitor C-like n=1 Tax=Drosophila rhopaloa TaxID=1041015 RepID=A0A6P4FGD8_DRORH